MQQYSMDNGAPKRKRGRPKGSKNKHMNSLGSSPGKGSPSDGRLHNSGDKFDKSKSPESYENFYQNSNNFKR
jgi:hypothetical protein